MFNYLLLANSFDKNADNVSKGLNDLMNATGDGPVSSFFLMTAQGLPYVVGMFCVMFAVFIFSLLVTLCFIGLPLKLINRKWGTVHKAEMWLIEHGCYSEMGLTTNIVWWTSMALSFFLLWLILY